jgi:hypothetical protein
MADGVTDIHRKLRFRAAARDDALLLAAVLDIASRGLVLWLWDTMSAQGQSAIEIGRNRIADMESTPSHYSRWRVACVGDTIAGAYARDGTSCL